ncbi:FAD-binding oxidoreductase [Kineosporia mesophila]|uniref:FAD-binding oxidoreductase n=1 Tax=Kineosporia mesophila TaxID=566012 RepID=A0ABP6ZNW1_9ACTN|nr:FAD-binding oxidoreductase [Kineosporia mesophila]MCD5353656.1 FAD-binding oxidoreductase [Kineosporia mesophila]
MDELRPLQDEEIAETLLRKNASRIVVRGCGTAGQDSWSLNEGTGLDLRGLNGVLFLDRRSGLAEVEAGVTLGALATLAERGGCVLPVRPPSLRGTVGGAIATDCFGGNHPSAGSFGHQVLWIDLMNARGRVHRLSPETTPERFWATVGGMGLTGIILRAGLRLQTVGSAAPVRRTVRVDSLDLAVQQLNENAFSGENLNSTVWTQRGGRGLMESEHQVQGQRLPRSARWGQREGVGRDTRRRLARLGQALHPAELGQSYPGLFGLVRHHCAIPLGADTTLARIFGLLKAARVGPVLTTLQRLGAGNPAPLSFPLPGWALALNFPSGRAGLPATLADVDALVMQAGGRLHLGQDSWLDAPGVAAMYPGLPGWRRVRDEMDPGRVFASNLAIRTGLVE